MNIFHHKVEFLNICFFFEIPFSKKNCVNKIEYLRKFKIGDVWSKRKKLTKYFVFLKKSCKLELKSV